MEEESPATNRIVDSLFAFMDHCLDCAVCDAVMTDLAEVGTNTLEEDAELFCPEGSRLFKRANKIFKNRVTASMNEIMGDSL